MKHLPNLSDYPGEEIKEIINLAIAIKKDPDKFASALFGKTLLMWFEKPSLRTRVSFEAGMTQLGGHAIYLDTSTTHKKAMLKDEIKCLSKYADIIMARVFDHSTIKEFVKNSDVPVINALCNNFHPCQALADMMTIFEVKGSFDTTLAYVGDGNNVCNSLIIAGKKLGVNIKVATPSSLKPDHEPYLYDINPKIAVKDAEFVYTDTWVSMGNELEKKNLITKLKPYQVNSSLLGEKYFMHCLPAYPGNEVDEEVIDSQNSLVFQQAGNRLHVQKAIMLKLLDRA